MATRTQSRGSSSNRKTASNRKGNPGNAGNPDQPRNSDGEFKSRSAFSWGGSNTGAIVGAALAGAAIGFAANYGRKLAMQAFEATAGDWDEILAAEHDMTLAIFDKMLATDQSQTWKRSMLLMKLVHGLDKHAHQEEMVVYPALREANMQVDSDHLNAEHLEIKTFIYELNEMGADSPNWLEKVREFRSLVQRHAREEEEEIFPRFKKDLTDEQNDRITNLVNRDGFWMT